MLYQGIFTRIDDNEKKKVRSLFLYEFNNIDTGSRAITEFARKTIIRVY